MRAGCRLFFAQGDLVGEQAVCAEDGEEERERAEGGGYLHEEAAEFDFIRHLLRYGAEVIEREIGVLGADMSRTVLVSRAGSPVVRIMKTMAVWG